MFLYLAIFCCLYLVQDPFTDYILCVSSDECVAGYNERITHENRHKISCDSHDREARPLQSFVFIATLSALQREDDFIHYKLGKFKLLKRVLIQFAKKLKPHIQTRKMCLRIGDQPIRSNPH